MSTIKKTHLEDQVKDFIYNSGYDYPEIIYFDSELHRFSGRSDKPHDKDEWYVAHEWEFKEKIYQKVIVGSWRYPDQKNVWNSWGQSNLEHENYLIYKEKEKKAREALEEERRKSEEGAVKFLHDLSDLETAHPYLLSKGFDITFDGLKIYKDRLVIPKTDEMGKLRSYEIIDPDGSKRCAKGCVSKNTFYKFTGTNKKIFIAEGFATAASIHLATGATVYCAFSAGNCKNVAAIAMYHNKNTPIVLCQDLGQAGDKASEDCSKLGIETVKPVCNGNGTDFNDMYQEQGEKAVKKLLCGSTPEALCIFDILNMESKPVEYYFDKLIQKNGRILITAMTGIGKSYFSLEMALRLACGKTFMKWKCNEKARVLYLENEMGQDEVIRRLQSISKDMTRNEQLPNMDFKIVTSNQFCENGPVDLYCKLTRDVISEMSKDYDVIFLDNFFCLAQLKNVNGQESHYQASSLQDIQEWLRSLQERNKTLILLHHSNKDGYVRGSRNLEYQFETHIQLKGEEVEDIPDEYKNIFTITFPKMRTGFSTDRKPLTVGYNPERPYSTKWDFLEKNKNGIYTKIKRGIKK